MKEEKFTFRQRWFPTLDDAEKLDRARNHSYNPSMGVGQFFGRWARSIILVGLPVVAGYQIGGNNIEYAQGERVGVINKISEKGLIWKTKEGQLSLEGRTSTGEYTGAGVWDFSIDNSASRGENVDEIYSQITQCMEEGQRVKITYKQDFAVYPWRAETTYLVQKVESLDKPLEK